MTSETKEVIELLAMALGNPVATPADQDYRVFLFGCPSCHGEDLDPDGIHRPLRADTFGNVRCYFGCSLESITDACEQALLERVNA